MQETAHALLREIRDQSSGSGHVITNYRAAQNTKRDDSSEAGGYRQILVSVSTSGETSNLIFENKNLLKSAENTKKVKHRISNAQSCPVNIRELS